MIIAQAAAVTATAHREDQFVLSVGLGQALNEHTLGDGWRLCGNSMSALPRNSRRYATVRLATLDPVEVIRPDRRPGQATPWRRGPSNPVATYAELPRGDAAKQSDDDAGRAADGDVRRVAR
ncbi:hypothetical protein [Actinocrispum sp. NPDC049592]|uniref:hypothetical protein n=1 Tax=Actinocrispum sp. NPDC049592 TaxID=3154835 RepID=UPI003413A51F